MLGKELNTADILLRAPLTDEEVNSEVLRREVNGYTNAATTNLLAMAERLQGIQDEQKTGQGRLNSEREM